MASVRVGIGRGGKCEGSSFSILPDFSDHDRAHWDGAGWGIEQCVIMDKTDRDKPMTIAAAKTLLTLPDHTQLPESDGRFVFAKRLPWSQNFQEHPQSILLTSSITPVLDALHPDRKYAIGQDCGIYWRLTEPPERGAEAPDWFYVPNVPPLLNGERRRSYVLWKEIVSPLIAISYEEGYANEFTSGDGTEERDRTSPLL